METYKKMVDDFANELNSKLIPFPKGRGTSPKDYLVRLEKLQELIEQLDHGLVDMGTKYWKDRTDFVKDDVEKIHAAALQTLIGDFQTR